MGVADWLGGGAFVVPVLFVAIAAGASRWLSRERTLELTSKAIVIRGPGVDVVAPLETIERGDVWGNLVRSGIVFVSTDGTQERVRLGSLEDHIEVARWLTDNLANVREGEALVPIEQKRLSRAALESERHTGRVS